MIALRLLNLLAWGGLLIYMLPGALGALGSQPRRGDAMRLGTGLVALIVCGFTARWFVAPDNMLLHQALYVLSIGVALFVAWLGRAYGRGGHV